MTLLGICTNPHGEGYSYPMDRPDEPCHVEDCDCKPAIYTPLPRVPIARQITRRIRQVAKTQPRPAAIVMYGVADFIAAEFDPGHLDGRPPWEQPR